MNTLEDARKQLEMLQVLKDHPKIVEERDECRKRVAELEHDIENKVAEILSLREVKMIVGEEPVALPQVRERINEIKAQEIKVEAQRLRWYNLKLSVFKLNNLRFKQ